MPKIDVYKSSYDRSAENIDMLATKRFFTFKREEKCDVKLPW